MTCQDFNAIQAFARSKGAVARFVHPLILVITTPEYEAGNDFLKEHREGGPPATAAVELFPGDGREGREGGQGSGESARPAEGA